MVYLLSGHSAMAITTKEQFRSVFPPNEGGVSRPNRTGFYQLARWKRMVEAGQ